MSDTRGPTPRPRLAQLLACGAVFLGGCQAAKMLPRMLVTALRDLPKARLPESPRTAEPGPLRAGAAAIRFTEEELAGAPVGGYIDRFTGYDEDRRAGRVPTDLSPHRDDEIYQPATRKRPGGPYRVARFLPPNRGFRPGLDGEDGIRVKALTLQVGSRRLAWVSLDTCVLDQPLTRAIQDELAARGAGVDLLWLSASHTHSGPGGFQRRAGLWLATGAYSRRFATFIRGRVADAVEVAITNEGAAALAWESIPVAGRNLVRTRRPGESELPESFSLLRVVRRDPARTPLAAVVLGALHPTVVDSRNLYLLSSDVTGAIEREIERRLARRQSPDRPVLAMFVQGAGGDMEAALANPCETPDQTMLRIARDLGASVEARFASGGATIARPVLDWATRRWRAGVPRLQCNRQCRPRDPEGRVIQEDLCEGVTKPHRTSSFYLPVPFAIPGVLPAGGPLLAVRVGPKTLVSVPAEPTHALGQRIRGLEGFEDVEFVSLTNGYLEYVVTTEQWPRRCGESCLTMYGKRTGVTLWKATRSLLEDLARRRDGLPPRIRRIDWRGKPAPGRRRPPAPR